MNKARRYILPVLLVAFFVALPAQGSVKKIAQTGMKRLDIPIGARASGLGGAYTAVANDPSAIFYNPAGLALTQGGHVFLNQTQWIADITVNAGAVSYSLENWGVFGLSFAAVDWGTINGTKRALNDAGFVETGEFSPDNYAIGLSYSRRISSQFSAGVHVKYLHEKLGSNEEGTFDDPRTFTAEADIIGFDMGTLFYTGFKDLRFGMSLVNFSEELKYRAESVPLPLTFKFGIAMDLTTLFMESEEHVLTLAVDALHPRDYTERLHFGLEYALKDMVFLRGGYKTNYDEVDISFGGGVKAEVSGMALGVDYAYIQFQNFDPVHMFSFDFSF